MGRTASTAIRVLLVLLDLVTLLFGVALFGLALFLYFGQHLNQLSPDNYRTPTALFALMAVGAIIALVSALGLVAALCRSYCCLVLYAVCFCLIVAAQCVLLLFAYVFNAQVKRFIQEALDELLSAHKAARQPNLGTAMDFVQRVCRCCGVRGFIDYMGVLPASCCGDGSTFIPCTIAFLQNQVPGCTQRLSDVLYGPSKVWTLAAAAGVLALELLLISMACYLCNRIRRERD